MIDSAVLAPPPRSTHVVTEPISTSPAIPVPALLFDLLAAHERGKGARAVDLFDAAGASIGAILLLDGRICRIQRSKSCDAPVELFVREDPRAIADLGNFTRRATLLRIPFSTLYRELPASDRERTKKLLLARAVNGLLGIAWSAAGRAPRCEIAATFTSDYDRDLTFSALDIYLAAMATIDFHEVDLPKRLYREIANDSELALLLTREVDGHVYPLAAHGCDELRLGDLAGLSAALGRESPFERVGEMLAPRLITFADRGKSWIAGVSANRQCWCRLSGDRSLRRGLSTAVQLLDASRKH